MAPTNIILVDNKYLLERCIADISSTGARPVAKLAIDLEGVELCRFGRISLLQILADCSQVIWLVDITTLGKHTFDHSDADGRSLRLILESGATKKLFYDVRNDADALFHLYNIELANVYDLQILEVAVRRSSNIRVRLVTGLGSAIERYVNPPAEWARIKNAGAALCFPDKGGSYDVVEQRPLDPRIIAYAAQDVGLLFQLERVLESKIGLFGQNWNARVASVSVARVREAHKPYSGRGNHRAVAPNF